MSTSSYTKIRNKILLETLMSPKFYKNKQNFILKEDAYSGAEGYVDLPGDVPPPPSLPSDNIKVGEDVLLDIVNISLDILGIFDPTGIADLSNMLIYIGREQYMDAFFSLLGAAIPYVGDTFKAAKVISKGVLIKGLDLVIGNAKAKKTIYEILMWLSKKSPACKKFADWVASFIYKNTNEIADYVLGKEAKQISKEIINKKMVEATSAWSIQGQKAAFKKHPFLKSLEILIAGHVLRSDIQQLFERKKQEIIYQLQLIEEEYKNKAQEIAGKGTLTSAGVTEDIEQTYEEILSATQLIYLLECTKYDTQLVGAILAEYNISRSWNVDAEKLTKSALELNMITERQRQEILQAKEKITKELSENKPSEEPSENQFNKEPSESTKYFINIWKKIGKFISEVEQTEKSALKKKQEIKKAYMPQIERAIKLRLQSVK